MKHKYRNIRWCLKWRDMVQTCCEKVGTYEGIEGERKERWNNWDTGRRIETNIFTYKHAHTYKHASHNCDFTHWFFTAPTLLHTIAVTHKHCYTQTLLHTDAFTQTLLHTEAFKHKHNKHIYTQALVHIHTQTLIHTEAFAHRCFAHRSFYTQMLLHTDAFTHRSFYTQTLLHQKLLHRESEREGERVKMWRWEDVKMRTCEDDKREREGEKVKMRRWEDEKMRRCDEDVKMRKCDEDVNIWRCIADLHYWKNSSLRRSREKCQKNTVW